MAGLPISGASGDVVASSRQSALDSIRSFSRIAADAGQKLNSQERIITPGDDALSFTTSRTVRTQIAALTSVQEAGQLNITGIDLALSGLTEIKNTLDQIKASVVQSQVADDSEKEGIQAQIDLALTQIDSAAKNTKLGSRSLLDGGSTIRAFESIADNGEIADFSRFENGDSLTTSNGVQGARVNKIGVGGATRLLDDGRSVLSMRVSLLSSAKADKANLSITAAPGAGEFVELRVTGKLGSATIRLESSQLTTIADPGGAVDSFNKLADETGVVITSGVGNFGFSTVGFGSDEFVKVEVLAQSGTNVFAIGGNVLNAVGMTITDYGRAAEVVVDGTTVELGGEFGTTARYLANGYDVELDFSTFNLSSLDGTDGTNVTSTVNIDLSQGVVGLLGTTGSSNDSLHYGFANVTAENLGRGNAQYTMLNVSTGGLISAIDVDGNDILADNSVADLGSSGPLALANGNIGAALDTLDRAIDQVISEQTRLGSIQGNFIDAIGRAEVGIGNLTAADSDIIGVDAATEITNLIQSQLGVSTASSVLGQVNSIQATVFSLLR